MTTIEKKYNEAMLRADEAVQKGFLDKDMFDIIFPPEESEDERIRKELVAFFIEVRNREGNEGYWHDFKVADILAYLEKQKESLHIPESCKENADSFTGSSEDEMIRKDIVFLVEHIPIMSEERRARCLTYLEKQKENTKNADSISADCVSDAKCEDRWHKTANSLPDSGRDVLAKDALGNYLLASFDSAQWFVSVYDGQDHPILHTPPILEWCDIPSEKQKAQKDPLEDYSRGYNDGYYHGVTDQKQKEQKPAECDGCSKHLEGYISGRADAEKKLLEWYGILWTPDGELRIKPLWKPSEEQMEALKEDIDFAPETYKLRCTLVSLYNDLKKLKED